MKILILTSFFLPDRSPGAFRTEALVKSLLKLEDTRLQIDLITCATNEFKDDINTLDSRGVDSRLCLYRTQQKTNNSRLSKVWSFFHYAKFAYKISSRIKYDVVFATSSKLGTAALGYYISRKQKSKLYLDIRDLFVENLEEILSSKIIKKAMLPLLRKIEKLTMNSANRINIVSGGFKSYFEKISPNIPLSFFTNGIDELFIDANFLKKNSGTKSLKVIYAGNIGEGQGLEKILPKAALKLGAKVEIKVIGNGAYRDKLINEKKRLGLKNLLILDPVSRDQLIKEYSESDILFMHLNNFAAFEKVIPSKVFEYGATGKPILAGVMGYPKTFIKQNLPDAMFFEPTNVEQLVKKLQDYAPNNYRMDRSAFIQNFSRQKIMDELALEIINL